MKTRILALLLALCMACGCMPAAAAAKIVEHSEEGFLQDLTYLTSSGMYIVDDVSSFLSIGTDPTASYILTKDIDLGEWTASFGFQGILFGNGHTIRYRSAGKMNRGDDYAVGLFTELSGAYIENLRVEATIDDAYDGVSAKPVRIGGIAAQAGGGAYLLNCTVNAQITVSTVQWLDSERSRFEQVVPVDTAALGTGEAQTAVGGMIGYIAPGTDAMLQSCRSTGSIMGADCTGGLVGQCMGTISLLGCENRAAITGVICAGGLIGSGSGECSIAQSGNRGQICALRAYAGGLAGSVTCSADDSIVDCANVGTIICGTANGQGDFAGGLAGSANCAITKCINKAQVICADPQPYAGNGEHVWEETCYAFDEAADYMSIRAMTLYELNMEMVWTWETDVDIPYPRMLCGEQVNQHRVAYVEAVQEALDMYPQELNWHLMQKNIASILGENYRDGWNNEFNSAWSATLSLSKVLDFDLSAFDDLAKYDTLICDLMLSEYFYKASQARAKSSAYDLFMEGCAENASAGNNLVLAGTAALRIELCHQYMVMSKNYSSGKQYLSSHDGLAQRFFAQGDRAKNAANSITEIDSAYSDVTGMAGIILNYFSIYHDMHSETELLNAAYDVYNSSFDHLDTLLNRIYLEASSGDYDYPEPFDAKTNLSLLSAAINDFCTNAIANKKHPLASEIGSELGDHLTALLGGAGSWAEWMYLDKLANAAGAQWLSELGLYKGAITVGRGINTLIGNDDYAYNGNLLNCAGYMADVLEPLVQEAYDAFLETPDYEKAVYFHDAIILYLSLQNLSIEYAQKMISGKFYNNYKEHDSMKDMLGYKTEIIALLTAFDFTGR